MNHESTIREWKSYRAAKPLHECNQSGFALIAAISVMALLVMVALAMLSLSTVELRNARNSSHQDIARANARTGLMLALGELQKTVGPDQRITAPSQIFEDAEPSGPGINHQHLTGVWTARNEELDQYQTQSPDYDRDNSFQRWLVSNSDPDGDPSALEETGFAQSGVLNDPVVMVGDLATSGSPMAEVEAGKIEVPQGKIAWWVGDENCKGYTAPTDTVARQEGASIVDHLASVATPGAYGMESVDEDFPANTLESDKVASLEGLTLVSSKGDEAREWFHDLSPYAKGILSNVTKGGLRKDLNLYLEMPRPNDPWPQSGGPARIGPNGKYALSEFDEYDVLSWKRLYEHYHFKENVQDSEGRPALLAYKEGDSDMQWNNGRLRPSPVMVRLVIFVSFGSVLDPTPPANADDPAKYVLRFYTYPVVTLWNPYNVDLRILPDQINILATSFPMEHTIIVNGVETDEFNWRGIDYWAGGNTGSGLKPTFAGPLPLTLKAGEAKMLSPNGVTQSIVYERQQVYSLKDQPFVFAPTSAGGKWGEGDQLETKITQATGIAEDEVQIRTDVITWEDGVGGAYRKDYSATWDVRMGNANSIEEDWPTHLFSSKVGWRHEEGTPDIAKPDGGLDKALGNLPTATFGDIFNAPQPFLVVDARLKALDEEALPNKTWRDTIPSYPFQAVTKDQQANDASAYFSQAYALNFKSINSYAEAAGYLQSPPNSTNTYFGGSYFPAGGQSFITDREIPLAPLSSIAQLQHLPQHSHDNLFASGLYFQNRAIGNSYASPGVRADRVKDSGMPFNLDMWSNLILDDFGIVIKGGDINGIGYARDYFHQRPNIDRSYAANHLLWDDYFFSSMAAKNSKLRASSEQATLEEVVRGFYEDGEPLANSRYRPYFTGEPSDVINELIDGSGQPIDDAYQKVASHLTVEGMFNVNSTSVEAWKTLLASAHKKKMVVMEASGGTPSLDKEARYVVSRFTMPNGGSADEPGATDPEQLKWRGYRELTETQIEDLAEAMVRQVKERGPFRSLAEFVNRRLADEDDDKSLYGALQAALEDPDVSINEEYRDDEITETDILDANYPNQRAALGSRFQGSPAYVNQADILNAIGPVLSARSDTFIIRGYGESLDIQGNVLAKTWCEAVVQRTPDYIDSGDQPQIEHAELTSDLNRAFGRKFRVVSFRWLSGEEV